VDDELQALLTITIPIVPNSQTDGDSSMPNVAYWVDAQSAVYDFYPILSATYNPRFSKNAASI
jgi:hypothetical protein